MNMSNPTGRPKSEKNSKVQAGFGQEKARWLKADTAREPEQRTRLAAARIARRAALDAGRQWFRRAGTRVDTECMHQVYLLSNNGLPHVMHCNALCYRGAYTQTVTPGGWDNPRARIYGGGGVGPLNTPALSRYHHSTVGGHNGAAPPQGTKTARRSQSHASAARGAGKSSTTDRRWSIQATRTEESTAH